MGGMVGRKKLSEPEKVRQDLLNLALSASNAAARPTVTETEAKIDYALFRVEGCIDREEFTQLQSDVAKLAQVLWRSKEMSDDDSCDISRIYARNRKES